MRSPHSASRFELKDLVAFGAAGLLTGLSGIIWATGRIAGGLFGRGKPTASMWDLGAILARLPRHLRDPRLAWPVADQALLPGATGWYGALLLVLVVVVLCLLAPAWFVLRLRLRRRKGPADGPSNHPVDRSSVLPKWSEGFAREPEMGRLFVTAPTPSRITLGHGYGRLIAAEREQSVLVVGATRSGKTAGFAIPNLIEWNGPAVVLSAKTDLVHATWTARKGRGEVSVFDPTGISGFDRTGWSPLAEAANWTGAVRIANAMSRLSGTTDGLGGSNHWQRVAAQLLAPLLHAAAIDDRFQMTHVLSWVKTQRVGPALAALVREENKLAVESLQATLDTEQRQRDSAFNTVRTVLDAYEDPDVLAGSSGPVVDPAAVLAGSQTLYLVATASDQARLAPLFLGILDQVLRGAFLQAAENRRKHGTAVCGSERLLLLLDEAANIAPLPDLATLASTAGGEGIQLVTIFQDLSQLRHHYGAEWGSIASNHVTRVLLPGVGDPETLRYFSQLSGEVETREESTTTGDGRSSRTESSRRRPLLDEAELRTLPARTGMLWSGALPPARLGIRFGTAAAVDATSGPVTGTAPPS